MDDINLFLIYESLIFLFILFKNATAKEIYPTYIVKSIVFFISALRIRLLSAIRVQNRRWDRALICNRSADRTSTLKGSGLGLLFAIGVRIGHLPE